MSLPILFIDLLVRQSVHSDPVAGDFVCHSTCGQLLADTSGRKYKLIGLTSHAKRSQIKWLICGSFVHRPWARTRGGVLVYLFPLLNCKHRIFFVWWPSRKSYWCQSPSYSYFCKFFSTFVYIWMPSDIYWRFCLFLNWSLCSGRAGLMTPFIYYHFLALRYSSRRNPYNRNMFHELRLAVEVFANNPRVPAIGKKILYSGIAIITRLAPTLPPVQQ